MTDHVYIYVVNAPSVNSFKNRLDKHWQAERFLYDYTAAVPGQQRAEDRARERDEDLTTEAPGAGFMNRRSSGTPT